MPSQSQFPTVPSADRAANNVHNEQEPLLGRRSAPPLQFIAKNLVLGNMPSVTACCLSVYSTYPEFDRHRLGCSNRCGHPPGNNLGLSLDKRHHPLLLPPLGPKSRNLPPRRVHLIPA